MSTIPRCLAFSTCRKQCVFEGLGDTLELVMSETGVSEHDFKVGSRAP